MEKTLSKYQIEIENKYRNSNSNLIIEAGPGSGKSFTILHLLKLTPVFKKTILVAFNKSIADELRSKVPEKIRVNTIHSLSYWILRQNTAQNYKVVEIKNFILGKKHLKIDHIKENRKNAYLFTISKIIDLSRMNLCNSRNEIEILCDRYGISTVNGEIDDVMKMLQVLDDYNDNNHHKEFMIDFTDMMWLAYNKVKAIDFPRFNVVFCDELQDLNPLQKKIIERIISPTNGRFIGVGDFHQSIYSFMGANLDSFKSFIDRPNTVVLPLSVTYRCSKKVTEEANKIFGGLEPFESNQIGDVRWGNLGEVEDGDFVICRNNMPLVEAWINIIKQGKKASIMGKDFGQNLISILNKLSKYDDYKFGTKELLRLKEEKLKESGTPNPKGTSNYGQLVEKLAIIEMLIKEFGSYEKLETKISEIFRDDSVGGITLCTGHKSKGLEADRVFFYQPELIPSKYAETELELYQEKCLRYVITTRAKKELIYV